MDDELVEVAAFRRKPRTSVRRVGAACGLVASRRRAAGWCRLAIGPGIGQISPPCMAPPVAADSIIEAPPPQDECRAPPTSTTPAAATRSTAGDGPSGRPRGFVADGHGGPLAAGAVVGGTPIPARLPPAARQFGTAESATSTLYA